MTPERARRKVEKLRALADNGATPAEADTARRLANEIEEKYLKNPTVEASPEDASPRKRRRKGKRGEHTADSFHERFRVLLVRNASRSDWQVRLARQIIIRNECLFSTSVENDWTMVYATSCFGSEAQEMFETILAFKTIEQQFRLAHQLLKEGHRRHVFDLDNAQDVRNILQWVMDALRVGMY